jgi:hypothetical protein
VANLCCRVIGVGICIDWQSATARALIVSDDVSQKRASLSRGRSFTRSSPCATTNDYFYVAGPLHAVCLDAAHHRRRRYVRALVDSIRRLVVRSLLARAGDRDAMKRRQNWWFGGVYNCNDAPSVLMHASVSVAAGRYGFVRRHQTINT